MANDDFFEEDEPLEDILRAWRESTEGGFTTGARRIPTVVWPLDFVESGPEERP